MRFDPPNGIVHVGSGDVIRCVRDFADGSDDNGTYALHDLGSRTDLLSVDNAVRPVRVGPPVGHVTYPRVGSTAVRCSYEDHTGARVEANLTVRILREFALANRTHFAPAHSHPHTRSLVLYLPLACSPRASICVYAARSPSLSLWCPLPMLLTPHLPASPWYPSSPRAVGTSVLRRPACQLQTGLMQSNDRDVAAALADLGANDRTSAR